MAKINARTPGRRTNHRVGPTFFTERVRPATEYEGARIYREAYRLRSDGTIQSRIIKTSPVDPESGERETKHSSAFTNLGRTAFTNAEQLRSWLERKGVNIVEESWR